MHECIFKSLYALCVTGAVSWLSGWLSAFSQAKRIKRWAERVGWQLFARQPQAAFLIAHTCESQPRVDSRNKRSQQAGLCGRTSGAPAWRRLWQSSTWTHSAWKLWHAQVDFDRQEPKKQVYSQHKLKLTHIHTLPPHASLNPGKVLRKYAAHFTASVKNSYFLWCTENDFYSYFYFINLYSVFN